jgi:preprotein translocase subunit SecF
VDANVLVFERIKEEHAEGRHVEAAAVNGFKRAWSAIADSNATTLIAAILLFFFASGAVKGFGITLTLGVAVSMFTTLVVTRILVELLVRSSRLRANPTLLGMDVGARFRRWLVDRGPDIIGKRRRWFAASFVVLVLAVAGLVSRGLNFGLEFQGDGWSSTPPAVRSTSRQCAQASQSWGSHGFSFRSLATGTSWSGRALSQAPRRHVWRRPCRRSAVRWKRCGTSSSERR